MTEVITNITLACVTINLNTFDSFLKRQSLSGLIKNQNLAKICKKIHKRKQIRKVKRCKLDKTGQEMETKGGKKKVSVLNVQFHTQSLK